MWLKWSRYRPGLVQRLDTGLALLFHDRGTRRSEWSAARPGRTLFRERPGTHFTGGCVGPRAGLDGQKNLVPHRGSIPVCPARSQSLYRLSYQAYRPKHVVAPNVVDGQYITNRYSCVLTIQGVQGGMCQTSGECSLGQTIPI